jgi:hypothetical protein
MTANDPAQAGRACDVRLLTNARSRPCLQPACYAVLPFSETSEKYGAPQ